MKPGSRDFDAHVAKQVFGYTIRWSRMAHHGVREPIIPELGFVPCPRYGTRIKDAWTIIEHLWRKHGVFTVVQKGTCYTVKMLAPRSGALAVESINKNPCQAIADAAMTIFEML